MSTKLIGKGFSAMKILDGSIDSGGYRSDYCVVAMSFGLFQTSDDIESRKVELEGVEARGIYQWGEGMEEMINAHVKELKEDIFKFMQTREHAKMHSSVKAKLHRGMSETLRKSLEEESVQLDVLPTYILHHLVKDRDKPIHRNFVDLIEKERLELIVNSYDSAGLTLKMKIRLNALAKEIVGSF